MALRDILHTLNRQVALGREADTDFGGSRDALARAYWS